MNEINYVDLDKVDKKIDEAVSYATISMQMEGFDITDEDKERLKEDIRKSFQKKLEIKHGKHKRHMG